MTAVLAYADLFVAMHVKKEALPAPSAPRRAGLTVRHIPLLLAWAATEREVVARAEG